MAERETVWIDCMDRWHEIATQVLDRKALERPQVQATVNLQEKKMSSTSSKLLFIMKTRPCELSVPNARELGSVSKRRGWLLNRADTPWHRAKTIAVVVH